MRRNLLTFITALVLCTLPSCEKAIYHSGEMILDGTTIRYLVSEKNYTLTVTAEGAVPTSPIYVKLLDMQSSALKESVIDTIVTIPHEKSVSVWTNHEYSLFLEKDGEAIGIGRFNF